jgi:hypothetical protein
VAEGARLESVYTGNRIVGSNPTPSATECPPLFGVVPIPREMPSKSRVLAFPSVRGRVLLITPILPLVDG